MSLSDTCLDMERALVAYAVTQEPPHPKEHALCEMGLVLTLARWMRTLVQLGDAQYEYEPYKGQSMQAYFDEAEKYKTLKAQVEPIIKKHISDDGEATKGSN